MRKLALLCLFLLCVPATAVAKTSTPPKNWRAHTTLKIQRQTVQPTGYTPQQIRTAYGITGSGSGARIAIVDAYTAPTIAHDLEQFDHQYDLPEPYGLPDTKACTLTAGPHPCFQVDQLGKQANKGWESESALDVEWAHAIAPQADIALVSAATDSLTDLLKAVDAASSLQPNAVSMSWGGSEFAAEASEMNHFNVSTISYVASAGDSGHQVLFPGVLTSVVSVGGTSLQLRTNNSIQTETAWQGSGGGQSTTLALPQYQQGISSLKRRTVPDVAYNADPNTGYSIYATSEKGWAVVGGTSAGAPQWAALLASTHVTNRSTVQSQLYAATTSFHDIVSGANGSCAGFCSAKTGFDAVSGLGTPDVRKLFASLH